MLFNPRRSFILSHQHTIIRERVPESRNRVQNVIHNINVRFYFE